MRKSRFSEEPITGALREQDAGIAVTELCRKHGVSSPTCYKWKAKYGALRVSDKLTFDHRFARPPGAEVIAK